MKKTGKILSSLAIYTLIANNAVYAASVTTGTESEGFSSKYIFLGVAALVIVLLLFLGYKMDSKGDEMDIPRQPKKVEKKSSKKEKVKLQEQDVEYEADNEISYESDHIEDDNDLNDEIEYETDDDEESLFAIHNDIDEESDEISNVEEDSGEEFDTSIIDEIEDEDLQSVEDKPKTSDETMVFNTNDITMGNLEDEIDNLDNIDDSDNLDIGGDSDSFINELKSFEEPESDFEGFSVATSKEEKEFKKDIKVKKEENDFDDIQAGNDFLSQMEENLEKDKKERKSKKTTTKKSSTTKKQK